MHGFPREENATRRDVISAQLKLLEKDEGPCLSHRPHVAMDDDASPE